MSIQRKCSQCASNSFQLIKHFSYKKEYYRIIQCLNCKTKIVEPLNPKFNQSKLALCPKLDQCQIKNECSGIISENGIILNL